MADKYSVFDTGFNADSPTVQQVDSLPSRMAVVAGKAKALTQQSVGTAKALLDKATPTADKMAALVTEPIESTLTAAAQLQGATYQTVAADTANRLQNVAQIAGRYLPPPPAPRKRGKRAQTQPGELAAPSPPGSVPAVPRIPGPTPPPTTITGSGGTDCSGAPGGTLLLPPVPNSPGYAFSDYESLVSYMIARDYISPGGTISQQSVPGIIGLTQWVYTDPGGYRWVLLIPPNAVSAIVDEAGNFVYAACFPPAPMPAPPPSVSPPPPPIVGYPPPTSPPTSPPAPIPPSIITSPPAAPPPAPVCPPPTIVCPSPPPPPSGCPEITCKCPGELTIAWLDLHYPDFVLASRSAAKTDYDILVDAYALGICEGDAGEMPECSIPYLERIAPAFIEAAKSQGKTDVETLQDAVAVGLCRQPDDIETLGTDAVESLAPGSEQELESEFDPPRAAASALASNRIPTAATDKCPAANFVIPDYSDNPLLAPAETIECLAGLDNVALVVSNVLATLIRDFCSCPDNGAIAKLFESAEFQRKEWSVIGKATGSITEFIGIVLRNIGCNVGVIDNYVKAFTRCGIGDSVPVMGLALLAGVWERWVGAVPDSVKEAIHAAVSFACPTGTPSTPESNALFASNFISRDSWECLLKKDGQRIDYGLKSVMALQARPTDDQLLTLERKLYTALDNAAANAPQPGDVDAESAQNNLNAVYELYANNGWTNDRNWQLWKAAQEWVPAPSDAIEWMLKDVQDTDIQSTFLLSAEFTQKYNGHVKDVFQWNGISENDALQIWKAHWRNMAPHQLYEMHKRLRPGWTALMSDKEITALAINIAPEMPPGRTPAQLQSRPVSNGFPVPTYLQELLTPEAQRAWLESLTTTAWHVSEALGQDDYPAFWRARQIALSYNVMGRIDLRRAYAINAISYERLVAGYLDQGSKPSDAQALAAFTRANQIQTFARNPLCTQWVKTGYDLSLLQDALEKQGMRPDMGGEVLAILQAKRQILIQTQCINAIKKRYIIGLLLDDAAQGELANLQLDADRIANLMSEWRCLKASRSKQESAAQICTYFKVGLINGQQAVDLLSALGYNKAQARRILALCYVRKLPKTIQPELLPEALQALGGIGQ